MCDILTSMRMSQGRRALDHPVRLTEAARIMEAPPANTTGSSRAWRAPVALVVTILVWASFLVVTRAAMTSRLGIVEVGLMRYGIGAVLFLPVIGSAMILLVLDRVEAIGHSFNIGNPRSTITIYQLAKLIVRLAGSDSDVKSVPWDFPDVELRVPDVKKVEKLLGFQPKVDLEDGLARTIEWYRGQLAAPANSDTKSQA